MKNIFSILFCAILFVVGVNSASAMELPSDLPALPAEVADYDKILFYRDGRADKLTLLAYQNANIVYESSAGYGTINATPKEDTYNFYRYYYTNGEWQQSQKSTGINILTSDSIATSASSASHDLNFLVYSDIDIPIKDTDDYFFQLPLVEIPLYQIVADKTAEVIPTLETRTVGTMTTLTLCGVGLMALLVVFALFGKVSSIFRI